MSNRVTLAQLVELPPREANALPVEQIAMLLEDVKAARAVLAAQEKALHSVCLARFGQLAYEARLAKKQATGKVRLDIDDHEVVVDLPKKVEWDQGKLKTLASQLEDQGEDPADYVETKLSIAERSFEAWPSSLKAMFVPARTVSAGKPTFAITRKEVA
jgi:hypothetical protein